PTPDPLQPPNFAVRVAPVPLVVRQAEHFTETGPGSGREGGRVVAAGTVAEVDAHPQSRVGGYLTGPEQVRVRSAASGAETFSHGTIGLRTAKLHTVQPAEVAITRGMLTVVTGVFGSGKSTLVLDSLVPALQAGNRPLPQHVLGIDSGGIEKVNV